MNTERIQPLNYCAHAIENLCRTQALIRTTTPASAHALGVLIDMLRTSVKFILPNCCELIDPDHLRQTHLDLVRLPFPLVALEAPWEVASAPVVIEGFQQSPATKRIALCWEADPLLERLPGLNQILDHFPHGGVFVVPVYWAPAMGEWLVPVGGAFLPYDNTLAEIDLTRSMPASRIAHRALAEAGQVTGNKHFRAEPFILLPEMFELAVRQHDSLEKAFAQVILDTRDEIFTLIQVCSVLHCANVATAELAAPQALNKKRRAHGKEPFFSYKVLQLSEDRRPAGRHGPANAASMSGPRMHLRRGHLRRLETRTIWVRPTMVNTGTFRGAVLKDYAVRAG